MRGFLLPSILPKAGDTFMILVAVVVASYVVVELGMFLTAMLITPPECDWPEEENT